MSSRLLFSLSLLTAAACSTSLADRPLGAPTDMTSSGASPDGSDGGLPASDAQLGVDANDLQFDAANASATLTIANQGGASSGALRVALTGNDGSAFVVVKDECAGRTLASGQRCQVSLQLRADTPSDFSASLEVSGEPGGAVTTRLHGHIVAATLAFSHDSVDFGEVLEDSKSAPLSLQIINRGDLMSGPLTVTAPLDVDLTIVHDACTGKRLLGGASCDLTVQLATHFNVTGTLTSAIHASAAPGGDISASVSVNVTPLLTALVPDYSFSPTGAHYAGKPTATLTVSAVGTTSATVSNVLISGQYSAFSIIADGCTGAVLSPSDSCTLTVQFDPSSGSDNEWLSVWLDHGHMGRGTIIGTSVIDYTSIEVQVEGDGNVISDDGQTCSQVPCYFSYPPGTAPTLTAIPSDGWVFTGWYGAWCGASREPTCIYTPQMNEHNELTALFAPKH